MKEKPSIMDSNQDKEVVSDFYKHRDEYIIDSTRNDLGYLFQQLDEEKVGLDVVKYEINRIVRELRIANQSGEDKGVTKAIGILEDSRQENDADNIKKHLLEAIHSF